MTYSRISGMGLWLPDDERKNDAWPKTFADIARASEQRELVDVKNKSNCRADDIMLRYLASEANDPFLGAKTRRIASPSVTSPEAEAEAARQALADASVAAEDVDVIMSWAAVPERLTPGSGPKVAHLLGARRAVAFTVDSACASAVTQLECAAALVESGRARHVLLTQSHLMSRAFKLVHPASPTVGDAATALLVSKSEHRSILKSVGHTAGEFYEAVTWCRGLHKDPPWWQAGSAFYLGTRDPDGAHEMVRSTVRLAESLLRDLATTNDIAVRDIAVLATMQPRRWVPQAIVEALDAPIAAPCTFDRLAHLGGCGVVANLIHARTQGLLSRGSLVALYAQGTGFTRAATLISW